VDGEAEMIIAKPENALCPACGTRIRFHQVPSNGDLLRCPECEMLLEVINRAPVELDWAAEEEEWYGPVDNAHFHTWS
jgi:lysine biosynthesis protein LysW